MQTALAATSLLMGLAAGPHCMGMCGAACAGVIEVRVAAPGAVRRTGGAVGTALAWQAGRLAGYSALGALAAQTVQGMAWLTTHTAALRPVWTLFHLAVLGWSLVLVAYARQPQWVVGAGRAVWARVRPLAAARNGVFAAGALWAFMPCGLLYSALLVASLSGTAWDGALSMALFAAGSGVFLAGAPVLLARLRRAGSRFGQDRGTRAAGVLLALASVWALWMDMGPQIAAWCQ